jgi:PAS domain S-box-containing protein
VSSISRPRTRRSAAPEPISADGPLDRLLSTLEELRASQEQLRESAEELAEVRTAVENERRRYQELFEFAPDGYLVTNMQGIIEEANRAAADLLGLPPAHMIGKPLFVYVARESRRDFFAELRMAQELEEPRLLETVLAPREKAPFLAEIRLAPARNFSGRVFALKWLVRDASERRITEHRLREYGEQLRALWSRLESVREEERSAIARELHDVFGQAITALVFDLQGLAASADGGSDSARYLDRMRQQLDQMLQVTRRMSRELRPAVLDDLGLEAAVEWQAREFSERTGILCRLVSGLGETALPPAVATATFRILQEALTNVARHSGAKHVVVNLDAVDRRLRLMVTDDGKGASAERLSGHESLGILGMRERARTLGGKLDVESLREGGTRVFLSVPLAGGPK